MHRPAYTSKLSETPPPQVYRPILEDDSTTKMMANLRELMPGLNDVNRLRLPLLSLRETRAIGHLGQRAIDYFKSELEHTLPDTAKEDLRVPTGAFGIHGTGGSRTLYVELQPDEYLVERAFALKALKGLIKNPYVDPRYSTFSAELSLGKAHRFQKEQLPSLHPFLPEAITFKPVEIK